VSIKPTVQCRGRIEDEPVWCLPDHKAIFQMILVCGKMEPLPNSMNAGIAISEAGHFGSWKLTSRMKVELVVDQDEEGLITGRVNRSNSVRVAWKIYRRTEKEGYQNSTCSDR